MARGQEHDLLYSLILEKLVFHCLFLEKKAIIITSKHGTAIFFPT